MKNRKRFQKFMLSAIVLTTLIPFASYTNTAQAAYSPNNIKPSHPKDTVALRSAYGLAGTLPKGKGGKSPYISIVQNSNISGVNGNTNANYVHDQLQTGILVKNKNLKGKAFGPTKSHFKLSREGGGQDWVVYTYGNNQSEKGKVGVFYENALTYYPTNDKRYKNKQPIQLDARLVWNGTYHYGKTASNANVQFNTEDLAIQEPYKGAANVTLQLYNHKTGKPFSTRSLIKQTDIDGTQGLLFDDPSYMIFDKHAQLNAGQPQGKAGVTWNPNVAGKSKIFGDNNHPWHSGSGTVTASMMREGSFSYLPKKKQSSFNITFVHQYKTTPYGYSQSYFAKPATSFHKVYSSIKRGAANADDGKNYAQTTEKGGVSHHHTDYFGFEFDHGTNSSYKIPIDKQVSTKPNHFEDTSNPKKALQVKNTQPIYFDIHTQLKEPSSALVPANNDKGNYSALPIKTTLKDPDDPNNSAIKRDLNITDNKSHQGLVLRDYIDKRFKVEKAYVVYSKNWGDKKLTGKAYDASKFFKVYKGTVTHKGDREGETAVDAVLRPDAMQASSGAWMKDYHLIIQVKLKDNIQPDEGSLNDGYLMYDNQAYLGEFKSVKHYSLN